ncbi:MAG: pentapeptide repeat-containing protein [Chloroflexaceae bacterium]|nr:pentapeptide repeat-containing protein [Chloroflexaceae bacterium]
MARKQTVGPTIQPPQIDIVNLAKVESSGALEPQASYAEQLWENAHFVQQQADDVAFEQLVVRHSSFQHAELTLLQAADCSFDTVDFANVALAKAYMRRVEFIGCRLLGLKLVDADLSDVVFTRCNGRLARFWTSTCKAIRFEQCGLQEASFDGTDLSGAIFHKCDLSGADFRNARLKGADLRGSTLANLQVHGKDLHGVIVDPAQAIELIQLFGVEVRSAEVE